MVDEQDGHAQVWWRRPRAALALWAGAVVIVGGCLLLGLVALGDGGTTGADESVAVADTPTSDTTVAATATAPPIDTTAPATLPTVPPTTAPPAPAGTPAGAPPTTMAPAPAPAPVPTPTTIDPAIAQQRYDACMAAQRQIMDMQLAQIDAEAAELARTVGVTSEKAAELERRRAAARELGNATDFCRNQIQFG